MKTSLFHRTIVIPARGVALAVLSVGGLALFVLMVFALLVVPVGIVLLPAVTPHVRKFLSLWRRLANAWLGTEVAEPYGPPPVGTSFQQWKAIITDPATWRDTLFLYLAAPVGVFFGMLPLALLIGWSVEATLYFVGESETPWQFLLNLTMIPLGVWVTPWLARGHGQFVHGMLAPSKSTQLTQRVEHLADTRTEAVDTSAAELRRIERDLHDGAQARLVAMGMSLGAAEHLIDKNPEAAKAVLAEARETSAAALSELRDLVRGIHPPVLADRGLGDAVRAIALDSPITTDVSIDLPGRLDAPVESAAYFAISEIIANTRKHAGAERIWIDISHHDGKLLIAVGDDGSGGADTGKGTGLRGIERRLATFDGVLALNSPEGGPTMVTMEIPCALSSPRTSSSSEMA